nr:MAG TPA: hypothetical protein [Caudoviricetes sp.]
MRQKVLKKVNSNYYKVVINVENMIIIKVYKVNLI